MGPGEEATAEGDMRDATEILSHGNVAGERLWRRNAGIHVQYVLRI